MISVKCLASIPNKQAKQPYRINIDGNSSLFMVTWKEVTEILRSAEEIRVLIQEIKQSK